MKTTFKSRYTDKLVTPAQYLAECVCERISQRDEVDLSFKFWEQKRWKKIFLYQVQVANSLLKIYRPEAIIAALRNNPRIYSLNAQFLDPLIRIEQAAIERYEKQPTKESTQPVVDTAQKPRPSFIEKKTSLDKLREI